MHVKQREYALADLSTEFVIIAFAGVWGSSEFRLHHSGNHSNVFETEFDRFSILYIETRVELH